VCDGDLSLNDYCLDTGDLYCCGDNVWGRCGFGDFDQDFPLPMRVNQTSGIVGAAGGDWHSLAWNGE